MTASTAGIAARRLKATIGLGPEPPSPPRSSQPTRMPSDSHTAAGPQLDSNPSINTPSPSPPSHVPSSDAGSGGHRKHVDFSPFATAGDIGQSLDALKALRPSREYRSSKSILKPGVPSSPDQEEDDKPFNDQELLMDHLMSQLATSDVSGRTRIYDSLHTTLKEYQGTPESRLINEQLQVLMKFIEEDLSAPREPQLEFAESQNLMLQTLKLLMLLVGTPNLSKHLSNAHECWILDHATQALNSHQLPKAVIIYYLHLLSIQSFDQPNMTISRAIRLLDALKDLSDHVPGNGIVTGRVVLYRRLLDQSKTAFRKRPGHWPRHLLEAMTSKIPDTRTKALELGQLLATHVGSSPTVSKAFRDVLDTEGDEQEKLSVTICKKLDRMLSTVNKPQQVPQIWSVVMLLLRGLESSFHEWRCLLDWIKVIQKCFNSSSSEIRVRANRAWDRLVYVARPHEDTQSFVAKMLIKPILAQLERPCGPGHSTTTRPSAFSSYCNLLYVALKPAARDSHYDAIWALYIRPLFLGPYLSDQENSDRACRILSSLFWKRSPVPWRPGRPLETMTIEVEELPLLDFRWTRSQVPSILEVFERLFQTSRWVSTGPYSQAHIATAWENFAKALGEACRKEVIPSPETISAARHVAQFLTRVPLWEKLLVQEPPNDILSIWSSLCGAMFSELGAAVFGASSKAAHIATLFDVEGKKLSNEADLLAKLLQCLQAVQRDHSGAKLIEAVEDLLTPFVNLRSSLKQKVSFCRTCCAISSAPQFTGVFSQAFWLATAEISSYAVETALKAGIRPEDMDAICADVRHILEANPARSGLGTLHWSALFRSSLMLAFQHNTSKSAFELLLEDFGEFEKFGAAQTLICTLDTFLSHVPLAAADAELASTKIPDGQLHLYQQLMAKTDSLLSRIYREEEACWRHILKKLVPVLSTLLRRLSTNFLSVALLSMQGSFALWLQDEGHLLVTNETNGSLKSLQAKALCPIIVESLERLASDVHPTALDSIIAAGLLSTQQTVAKDMLKMWKSSYKSKRTDHGPLVKAALSELGSSTEPEEAPKLLPLPMAEGNGNMTSSPRTGEPVALARGKQTAITKSREKNPRARPKHEDSQIDFVPVHSSPRPELLESQDLTTRQKEVRAKQARDAPLGLMGIGSSPMEASRMDDLQPLTDCHSGTLPLDTATPISLRQRNYEEAIRTTPTPKSKAQQPASQDLDLDVNQVSHASMNTAKQVASEPSSKAGELLEEPMDDLPVLHSDDNDFWSASQLSQELRKVVGPTSTPSSVGTSSPSLGLPVKRRLSSTSEQANKKAKSSPGIESLRGIQSPPPSSPQQAPLGSTCDTATAHTEQDMTIGSSPPAHPRPLKIPESPAAAAVQTGDTTKALVAIEQSVQRTVPSPGTPFKTGGHPNSVASPAMHESNKENYNSKDEALSLLEKALRLLRQSDTVMDRTSLRTVDDLVFEIRTEAQNATQRS